MTKVDKNIDFLTDDDGNLIGSRNVRREDGNPGFNDSYLAVYATDTSGNVTGLVGPGGMTLALNPPGSTICAAFGDSITAQNTIVTSSQTYMYSHGYMVWASVLSGGRLFFSPTLNFGVNGDTTTQMVDRAAAAAASAATLGAKYVAILAGTNDITASVSFTTITTNLAKIYAAFLGLGVTPLLIPILPRANDGVGGSMTTASRQRLQRVNNWIRQYARDNPAVIFADPTFNITDYALTNGDPIGALAANATAYTYDGLHPANRAAYWIGKAVADAMQYRLAGASMSMWSPIDTHDITHNPTGNMLANGFMAGTGGTNGTGSSGSVATSFTARRLSGTNATVVASKVTSTNTNGTTYPLQRLVCAGAGGGSSTEALQIYQQIFVGASTYAVGDTVYAECEVTVSGITADTFRTLYLNCADANMSARIGHMGNVGYMPNTGFSGVFRTPAFVVATGTTALTVGLVAELDGTIACGVTVDIGRMTLRKV